MAKSSKPQNIYESEVREDWLDRLARFNQHFGRFARDAVGVLLLAIALMTLLALTGYTEGILLTPLAELLSLWFGWGAYLIVVAIGYSGYAFLRHSPTPLPWSRLFALELAAFLSLALLAARGGNSLLRAESGMDGGRVGWGLVTLFWQVGTVPGTLFLFISWLLVLMVGFNLWALLERSLMKLAGEAPPVEARDSAPPEAEKEAPAEEKKEKQPRKKSTPLPPEFRKSLKVSEHQDKKPAAPRERDEHLPSLNILLTDQNTRPDERTINQTAGMIEKTLAEFGIVATVIGFRIGPTVTQFAVQPGFMKRAGSATTTEEEAQQIKVRVAQIASLQKDLALALSAERLRIEAPVPGKPYIGIEVPNSHTSLVRMRSILETDAFHKIGTPLAMALGRDVSGQPVVADLARMPHLLIAGATGSGKSVCITALASCLAMNNPPEDLRMVMID
ncbi:MAG: DNA translocase FtsK, partial [Chloroflexi bacterium]